MKICLSAKFMLLSSMLLACLTLSATTNLLLAQETVFRSGYEDFVPPVLVSEISHFSPDNRIGAVGISDADGSMLEYAKLVISNNYRANNDILSFVDSAGISGNWNADSGELLLVGTASQEVYESALRKVILEDTQNIAGDSSRVISITVNDGIAQSNIIEHDCVMNDGPFAVYLRIDAESDGFDGVYVFLPEEELSNGVPIYHGRELANAWFGKPTPFTWQLTSNNGDMLVIDALSEDVMIPEGSSEWMDPISAETEIVTIHSIVSCEP